MRNYVAWISAVITGAIMTEIPFPGSIPGGLLLGMVSYGIFMKMTGEL
jgi:hypothetical protein